MTSEERAFASVGPAGIVHYAMCWDCQTAQHPGGLHGWADANDVKHALATGQPDPSQQRCGCPCTDGPVLDVGPIEPDFDEISIDADPCPLCGERGACGYDSEGRALIHALGEEESS